MAAISVVVPVYNVEKYLSRCADSILAQTFTDFELILVDDGSPDNCGKICDGYAAKDSRVKVVHKENGGVSAARNVGTAKALGDYVTYIDSDDWITRDYLERLYNAVTAFRADISVTHLVMANDEGAAGVYSIEKMISMNPREAILRYAGEDSDGIRNPVGKLIRRDIAQGLQFPLGRHYAEDTACVYQWYWHAKQIVDIQDKLYIYYRRSDSVSHEEYSEKRLGEYDTLREMIPFLKENGFDELSQKYICTYLIKAVGAYQFLYASHSQLANQVYDVIQQGIKCYLQTNSSVESYWQLINACRKKNPDMLPLLAEMTISRLSWTIPMHIKTMGNAQLVKKERKCLRRILLKYRKAYHFSCVTHPAAYEVAFPHTMKYFWIIYAQIKKLRRK